MVVQKTLLIETPGRGTLEISGQVQNIVSDSGVSDGLCQVFVHHTSASLILCENADPDVRHDLETFMTRIAPDGDPDLTHTAEGPDDMPAHLRSVITLSNVSVPVVAGRCDLGTWQGIYLWEHRHAGHRRRLTISVLG
jgi:secondary thiamine-phosphate synthase enzyme